MLVGAIFGPRAAFDAGALFVDVAGLVSIVSVKLGKFYLLGVVP